jgi:N6-L-threonylcarbamoyladenine synthase
MPKLNILAIESSCDDTSAAIISDGQILSNCMANQKIHQKYGGVLPEAASRAHQTSILPVVQEALHQANMQLSELSAIAFTRGPGLMGSLLVGVSFAKGLALSLKLPMIAVHHIQAHVLAHFIEAPRPKFPFLCLTVSGGHTQIMLVRDYLDMQIIGTTIDDAAGEAFDKTAKLLGLGYPGGPILDKLAQAGKPRFAFSEPNIADLDFSFSGLKTQFLRFLQQEQRENPTFVADNLNDICASVQERIVSFLMNKLTKAAKQYNIKEIAIAGGVSANSGLRTAVAESGKKYGWNTYIPAFAYCTDNAAMIAMTAHYLYLAGEFVGQDVAPLARYEI